MKVITLDDLQRGFSYLASNPTYLLRSAVNAARMRLGIPLDGVKWLLGKAARGKLPPDLQLEAVPPGLRISATANVMGAAMFVSGLLTVEQVVLGVDSLRVSLRVRELAIKPPPESPIASMLGMMDLTKPGDLLGFMPMKPAMIVSAHGDLFVLDLLKLPKLAKNPLARRIVAAMSEVLSVKELGTEGDLLVLGLGASPLGFMAAIGHLRE
jgi:hypothetical protein